jgi:hypothetical protein
LDEQKAKQILQVLQHMRLRPGMWFSDTVPPVVNTLIGMGIGLGEYFHEHKDVVVERGWTVSSQHPALEMKARGMSDEAITHEILTIAIESLKRRYNLQDDEQQP